MARAYRPIPFLLLAAALLASGCAPGPPPKTGPEAKPEAMPGPDPEALMERGEHARAAEAYARRAARAAPDQRPRWRLRQAEALFRAGRGERAQALARGLTDTDQRIPAALLRARIFLEQNRPTRARAVLDAVLTRPMPEARRAEALDILGRVHLSQQRPLNAFDAWLSRYRLLEGEEDRRATHQRILQALQAVAEERLRERLMDSEDALERGYLRFALIMRGVGERAVDETRQRLERWLKAFPGHPLRDIVGARMERVQAGPLEIAVLLPLDSRYEPLARGLLRGVLAAHFQAGGGRGANLHILDTAASAAGARRALARARNLAADAVLGPLTPDAARAVGEDASRDQLPAPVLMLNTSQRWMARSPRLFQLGLDPEEEARQVAERAQRDGHERAALLYPDTTWGKRLVAAFQERWRGGDGLTYALQAFDPEATDHSEAIRRLLALDKVRSRIAALEGTLGVNFVEYKTPPRRRDLDFLFLLAQPDNARLIKPQLEFYAAGDLPVLATSSVFSSDDDRAGRSDMDDIRFLQMPWFLDPAGDQAAAKSALGESYDGQGADLQRLNALGFDAYRLMTRGGHLARLSNQELAAVLRGLHMEGGTGALAVGEQGWVQRRLDWAHYRNGWGLPETRDLEPGS